MRLFQWNNIYSVYIPEIDAEHQQIFRIAAGLYRVVTGGADPDELEPALQQLVAHAGEHFLHEERLMRSTGYEGYAWHKRQHDTVRAKVIEFERSVRRGDRDALFPLLHFLSAWLKGHTQLTDRMMAAHLRNHMRQHFALAS